VSWRTPRAGNADRNSAPRDAAIRCQRVHAAAAEVAHSGGPLVPPTPRACAHQGPAGPARGPASVGRWTVPRCGV